ncbi:MAG: hypothetical protein ACK52I_31935 [Pseudomonadota bacterium]
MRLGGFAPSIELKVSLIVAAVGVLGFAVPVGACSNSATRALRALS